MNKVLMPGLLQHPAQRDVIVGLFLPFNFAAFIANDSGCDGQDS